MSKALSLKTRTLDKVRKVFTVPPLESAMMLILRGVEYEGFWSRFIPNPHLYPLGSMRRVTRGGIKYELDVSCMMQWYVFWDLKERQREKLYSNVNKGDIVLDVGTNIGETLFHFAGRAGSTGFVYGFEPDAKNFANVQRNLSLNDLTNVHVFNVGVSDKPEKLKLYRVDEHNLGMNRVLIGEEAAKFTDHTTIETDTIDNIVAANDIERVDLIKIDIEGYEMHALRGSREVLTKFRPRLFIEVGYQRLIDLGTSPNEMVRYLHSLGYAVFDAGSDKVITEDFDFSPWGEGGFDVYAEYSG